MMRRKVIPVVLPMVLAIASCGREPLAPAVTPADAAQLAQKPDVEGSGLVIGSLTEVQLPILNALGVEIGDVTINQAVIKEFGTVEDIAGNIVGLEATGVLELTGGLLGTEVVTEEFTTGVGVISTNSGQCDVVTVDLSQMRIDAIAGLVFADVPAAEVTTRGNGAVGSLLCSLGQVAQGLVDGVTRGVKGLVNALNNLLI
jgi:hypothetical protein